MAAIIVNGVVDLAAITAGWNLVKSGRVRLSAPTVTQLQAGGQPQAPAEETGPAEKLRSAS